MRIRKNEEFVHRLLVETGAVEIDEDGRLWRVARYSRGVLVPCPRRETGRMNLSGYYGIRIIKPDGHSCTAFAHRIVWMHFNGPIPDGMVINHKNLDKRDNRPANLEPLSHWDNVLHARRMGAIGSCGPGELHHAAKLTEADVVAIRRRSSAGDAALAAQFGVSRGAIYAVLTGRTWSHVAGEVKAKRSRRKGRSIWGRPMTDTKLDELIQVFSE